MIAAAGKLTDVRLITGARPNALASGALVNGAVILTTRPLLKMEVADERRLYSSAV